MATREIKTTIALDGEAEFKRALADANREMRLMGAELKELAAEFDLSGDEQAYYARRSETLGKEMQQQKIIVDALEKAVQDMAEKHGDASRQVQDMTIQLTNARTKLNRIQKEFNDNEKASRDFGKSLDKNVEEEAEQAGEAVTELRGDLEGLEKELEGIRGGLGELSDIAELDLGMDIFGEIPDWVQQLLDLGAEGREWKRGEAATKYTAERIGLDEEFVKSEIMDIAAVTGDKEAAQEGTRMLMNIQGITEDMLSTINDNALGASLLFPELGYGQLAEGFQESASSGEVTGPLLELYERSGYQQGQIDQLNNALQNEPTQAGRAQILLTAMKEATPEGGMGFVEFLAHYKNNEKTLIDAEMAQQIADDAWSKAMASEPVQKAGQVVNSLKMMGIGVLTGDFSGLINYTQATNRGAFGYWEGKTPQNWYEWRLFENFQAPPEGYDPEKVGKAPWLYWGGKPVWIGEKRTDWGEPLAEYQGRIGGGTQGKELAELLRGKMPAESWSTLAGDAAESARLAINRAISPKRMEPPEPEIKETPRPEPTPMPTPTPTPVPTPLPTRQDAEELKTATEIMLQTALEGAKEALGDLPGEMGIDIGDDLGAGITESGGRAVASMRQIVDDLNAEMSRIAVPQVTFPTAASGAAGAGAGGSKGGNIYLDGYKVGSVMLPTINRGLGRDA